MGIQSVYDIFVSIRQCKNLGYDFGLTLRGQECGSTMNVVPEIEQLVHQELLAEVLTPYNFTVFLKNLIVISRELFYQTKF